jgi:small-conductance mechanosensitive channel
MLPMTSLHVNRVRPIRATSWFVLSIATTMASLAIGVALWSVTNGWIGLAASLAVAALVAALADRRSHRNLAAFALGAVVTMVGLFAAPLVMAHMYVAAFRG